MSSFEKSCTLKDYSWRPPLGCGMKSKHHYLIRSGWASGGLQFLVLMPSTTKNKNKISHFLQASIFSWPHIYILKFILEEEEDEKMMAEFALWICSCFQKAPISKVGPLRPSVCKTTCSHSIYLGSYLKRSFPSALEEAHYRQISPFCWKRCLLEMKMYEC